MRTGAYIAVPCIHHVSMLHIGHIGLEGPGCLCKLPKHLMVHAQPWNPEVPALGVARHFAKVLGNENLAVWLQIFDIGTLIRSQC